jgi:hypothetical protein
MEEEGHFIQLVIGRQEWLLLTIVGAPFPLQSMRQVRGIQEVCQSERHSRNRLSQVVINPELEVHPCTLKWSMSSSSFLPLLKYYTVQYTNYSKLSVQRNN